MDKYNNNFINNLYCQDDYNYNDTLKFTIKSYNNDLDFDDWVFEPTNLKYTYRDMVVEDEGNVYDLLALTYDGSSLKSYYDLCDVEFDDIEFDDYI